MKKLISILILYSFFSCHPVYNSEDFVGVYTGYEKGRKGAIKYNYSLVLKRDSTCEFIKSHDIYKQIGLGYWVLENKSLLIEYRRRDGNDLNDYLFGGSIMEANDTFVISNTQKIKIGKVVLTKKTNSE